MANILKNALSRGTLMALAVLVFHFQKWSSSGFWDATTVVGKLGVYAVSVFFVLSGLTLALVYTDMPLGTWRGNRRFFAKRLGRILPLLWLATVATFALDHNLQLWGWGDFFFNMTGIFGFVCPGRDIALGAWSLGNELVFYAFFPILWLFFKKIGPCAWWTAFVLSASAGIFYAFCWVKRDLGFQEQWTVYTQPAHHFFFFAAGTGLGFFQKNILSVAPRIWWVLLVAVGFWFAFWPVGAAPTNLIFGADRLFLSALAILFAAAFFGSRMRFSGQIHSVLTWLADCSYSIYLLHPIVFRLAKWANLHFFGFPMTVALTAAFLATMLVSHFIFKNYERPMKRIFDRF